MKAWGVQGLVGKSFARIFRRNCINLGLPVLECPEAAEVARTGSRIRVDTDTGVVEVDGRTFQSQPFPELVLELQASGGLVPWARERLRS
jgi:3-isopropylmalate/(R)-2-methylmalate dehydratase small subunit